jgi:hypothetical protein
MARCGAVRRGGRWEKGGADGRGAGRWAQNGRGWKGKASRGWDGVRQSAMGRAKGAGVAGRHEDCTNDSERGREKEEGAGRTKRPRDGKRGQ